MQAKDIKDGETYFFLGTDSVKRKHLEGRPFTVQYREAVFRRFKGQGTRKRMRFFNDDGVGARASELESLPQHFDGWAELSEEEQEALVASYSALPPAQDIVDLPF